MAVGVVRTEAPSAPRTRATEALEFVSRQYGTERDLLALRAAGDDWRDEAIAQLAEGLATLLLDLPARPANVERRRHRQSTSSGVV